MCGRRRKDETGGRGGDVERIPGSDRFGLCGTAVRSGTISCMTVVTIDSGNIQNSTISRCEAHYGPLDEVVHDQVPSRSRLLGSLVPISWRRCHLLRMLLPDDY